MQLTLTRTQGGKVLEWSLVLQNVLNENRECLGLAVDVPSRKLAMQSLTMRISGHTNQRMTR